MNWTVIIGAVTSILPFFKKRQKSEYEIRLEAMQKQLKEVLKNAKHKDSDGGRQITVQEWKVFNRIQDGIIELSMGKNKN